MPEIEGHFDGCDLLGDSRADWSGAFIRDGTLYGNVTVTVSGVGIELPTTFSARASNPAGLPAVTGEASWTRGAGGEPATTNSAGAFRVTLAGSTTTNAVSGAGDVRLDFDASWSNPIYGASPTVMPASVDLPVCLYLGLRA